MGHLDHDHTHDHTHSHDHDHLHSHEPLQAKDGAVDEQTVAVLRYMLDHKYVYFFTRIRTLKPEAA